MSQVEVKRALVSVSDKTGLIPFVTRLVAADVEIVSSGGTADAVERAGLPVTRVADITGSPEILGGRVKTLHPVIHGAILADLGEPDHVRQLDQSDIQPFQLVVTNLYPFQQTVARRDATEADIIEQIDIGGPAMVRAAAKNHAWVAVATSPVQYDLVAASVEAGGLTAEHRVALARAAFYHTAAYDAAIVNWLEARESDIPERLVVALERDPAQLKYGENPHQPAARFSEAGRVTWWDDAEQLSGPPASYLNVFDTDAAWRLAHELDSLTSQPTVVIVKHANPCGVSSAETLADAYTRAFECDPRSAFGGIVAFSRSVDSVTAERIVDAAQADVIIAPAFDAGTVEAINQRRRNTRVFRASTPAGPEWHIRQTAAGWLVQVPYAFEVDPSEWKNVSDRPVSEHEMRDAVYAWRVCGHTTSNAVVVVKDQTAWGIGAGQQNRVEASQIAMSKAAGRAVGGALASDAFFPFPDGIDVAAESGVTVVVQPGGSIRDVDVTTRANELQLSMLMTGERQFRH